MKVFLSWSGDLSLKVACALRDWLPSAIQSVKPYVSSEDIDKGARWSTDIAQELKESSFGVICVTKANMETPWINFEAGALSKTFDKSKVCPFLFDMKRAELQGPLLQFQSVIFEKDELKKLLVSLNSSLPKEDQLDEGRLDRVFEVWWPELKQNLDALPKDGEAHHEPKRPHGVDASSKILEELLELARNQQKLLRSPPELLPPEYLAQVIMRHTPAARPDREFRDALEFLTRRYADLQEAVEKVTRQPSLDISKGDDLRTILDGVQSLRGVIRFLSRDYWEERDVRRARENA